MVLLYEQLERRRLLAAAVFQNPAPIATPVFGHASTYPATITVSGLAGYISRITATLSNINHEYPDDYDILLAGPQGQSVMLMSDVGGGFAAIGRTLTFDDLAAASIPNEGPLVNGSFKPTNIIDGDSFAAPVLPVAPSGTTLSVFHGTDPNGTWKLYVVDDFPDDIGSIDGGWSLSIETQPLAPPAVTAISPAPTTLLNSTSIDVDVTFSEAAIGLDVSDLVLSGAAANGASLAAPVQIDAATWRYSITGLKDGMLGLSLAPDPNDIENAAGADVPNAAWVYRIDKTPPLASWLAVSPNPRSDAAGIVTVNFSEDVGNVDLADFVLARDGQAISLAGAAFSALSATQYTLDLSSVTALPGSYTLALSPAGSGIADTAGNPLSASASTSWLMNAVNATAGNDTIRLIRSASVADQVDVFINNATASPDYSFSLANFGPYVVRVLGHSGDDTIIIDFANGEPAPYQGVAVDGGEHATGDSLVIAGTTGDDSAAFNSWEFIFGETYVSYVEVENFRFDGGDGNDALTIEDGLYRLTSDASETTAHLNLIVEPYATVEFSAAQQLAGLTLRGLAVLAPGGAKQLLTRSLDIAAGGLLDLGDGQLIVKNGSGSPIGTWNGSAYTGITGRIASGRSGGSWTGSGIVTSMPPAISPDTRMTLGSAEASVALGISGAQTATWNGMTVTATTALTRYTWQGDANLDGQIDGDDYFLIDQGIAAGAHGYAHGDFDYNGVVDADDYFLIDVNYHKAQAAVAVAPPAPLYARLLDEQSEAGEAAPL